MGGADWEGGARQVGRARRRSRTGRAGESPCCRSLACWEADVALRLDQRGEVEAAEDEWKVDVVQSRGEGDIVEGSGNSGMLNAAERFGKQGDRRHGIDEERDRCEPVVTFCMAKSNSVSASCLLLPTGTVPRLG